MDENQKLLDINQDLESKGINLRIEKRGKVLNIRGSLPDKKSPSLYKIQRISLKLPYNIRGLEEAKKAIELIDFQLKKSQFSWHNWIKEKNISFKSEIYSWMDSACNWWAYIQDINGRFCQRHNLSLYNFKRNNNFT